MKQNFLIFSFVILVFCTFADQSWSAARGRGDDLDRHVRKAVASSLGYGGAGYAGDGSGGDGGDDEDYLASALGSLGVSAGAGAHSGARRGGGGRGGASADTLTAAMAGVGRHGDKHAFMAMAKSLERIGSDRETYDGGSLVLSTPGENFIKWGEGFRKDVYDDGKGYATIGYGHKIEGERDGDLIALGIDPKAVLAGTRFLTKAEAERLFERGVTKKTSITARVTGLHLAQCEFDAFTSFSFNYGPGAFAGCDSLKSIRRGEIINAADLLSSWALTATGVKGQGVIRRAVAHTSLFLSIPFDPKWRDISSNIGVSVSSTDKAWAGAEPGLKREISKAVNDYIAGRGL